MVQILPNKGNFLQQLLGGAAQGLPDALSSLLEQKEQRQESSALKRLGYDVEGIKDPRLKQLLLNEQQQSKQREGFPKGQSGDIVSTYENMNPSQRVKFDTLFPKESASINRILKEKNKPPPGGITAQPVPDEVAEMSKQIMQENPDASASELAIKFDKAKIPRGYSNSYIETRRREEESRERKMTALETETRKEVAPMKKEIAEKATQARSAIQNKEYLMNLIDTGKIDDPTFANIAYAIPLDLGKRFLSPETVTYKSALLDEFGDLRKMFQGQTRVKEIEIFEEKLADVYFTDEQKKSILKSRIKSLKGDIIKAEAAEEVEKEQPGLGILQFEKTVAKKMEPKMKELADEIFDEHAYIIKQAERQKEHPLDPEDPSDKQLMDQIWNEAGQNPKKAFDLAIKKGYRFK